MTFCVHATPWRLCSMSVFRFEFRSNGKQLACSMCCERIQAPGINAREKDGTCKASFHCKIRFVVMHDSQDDCALHVKMVQEDHPSVQSYIKYDPKKHTKKPRKKKP